MAKTTINGDNGEPVKRIHRGERTAIELYDRLWDVLDGLDENLEATKANAFANVTGKIMGLAKLQMEHAKLTGQPINIPMLGSGTKADEQPDA